MGLIKGKFIAFEGIDGSGKTTQIAVVEQYLKDKGFEVVRVREPGGTEVGERIRDILLNVEMTGEAELMLFTASRLQLIKTVILPALKAGKIVLADRFLDSTMAYQGYGRQLYSEVLHVEKLVTDLVKPDHVFFLNVSLEVSNQRMKDRGAQDRLDAESPTFKHSVKNGFIDRMERNPRALGFDANKTIEEVSQDIKNWLDTYFIESNLDLVVKQGS